MDQEIILPGENAAAAPRNQNRPEHYKIGRKLNAVLHEMVRNGGNAAKAAQVVGMAPESVYRAMRKEHVRERLKGLLDEHKLILGTKALATLDQCMDDKSGYVRVQAASKVADITGHTKDSGSASSDRVLNVQINIG